MCIRDSYCIIDNPPDIGLNVVNALAITDEVIVPVKVDEDALEGLDIVTEHGRSVCAKCSAFDWYVDVW